MRSRLLSLGLLISCVCLLVGCERKPAASVRGKVLVNGTPLANGFISFQPVDGATKTVGAKIVDGNYLAADVPVGEKAVQVVAANPRTDLGGSGDAAKRQLTMKIPLDADGNNARHTVAPGEQSLDLDIRY